MPAQEQTSSFDVNEGNKEEKNKIKKKKVKTIKKKEKEDKREDKANIVEKEKNEKPRIIFVDNNDEKENENEENIIIKEADKIQKDKKKKKNNKDNIDELSVKKSYTAKDLALSKMNSKVQFSEGVSNKEMDMDFYHNRGKDSNLDLRSLERLEKIDF